MIDWIAIQSYISARNSEKPASKMMETVISQNGEVAYFYALRVLHGRFPKGEKAISKIPSWAVRYARFIIKKRFVKAEDCISKDPEWCYEYFKHVIKKKLPPKMHQAMLMMSFKNPQNHFVSKYFKESE